MQKPTCPAHLVPLFDLFIANGERAYPVGGCVRDTLMGTIPHDWDVAVTTTPERTEEICNAAGYSTIPTGIRHGTVTVIVPLNGTASDREDGYDLIECTTCRTEGGYTDGRHPDAVSFTGRIEDDLSRRDFTVNAMAFEPTEDGLVLVDLFGGREDLAARVIRCVGDPDTRFSEDALRLLRAVRFASRLGFDIEENTRDAIMREADGLSRISRERVRDELLKILTGPAPDRGVTLLCDLGLMPYVLPCGITREALGRLAEVDCAADWDFEARLAALLWNVDSDAVRQSLDGLRLSNADHETVLRYLTLKDLPIGTTLPEARVWRSQAFGIEKSAVALYRIFAPDAAARAEIDIFWSLVREAMRNGDPYHISQLALNGRDLISLGVPKGRAVGDMLESLLAAVLDDPRKNTREALTDEVLTRQK